MNLYCPRFHSKREPKEASEINFEREGKQFRPVAIPNMSHSHTAGISTGGTSDYTAGYLLLEKKITSFGVVPRINYRLIM